jgi:hypothetical protein
MAKDYDVFVPHILPLCPGAPDFLIERVARDAIIELCQDARVLRRQIDPITLVVGEYEYDLEPPANTVVHDIDYISYKGDLLKPVTARMLERDTPDWRSRTSSRPRLYMKYKPDTLIVVPKPTATVADALDISLILKPSRSSITFDDELFEEYFDTIVNNILARLMRMPKKDWTDKQSSAEYYALYHSDIERIRREARKATGGVAPVVSYGGIGGASGKLSDSW